MTFDLSPEAASLRDRASQLADTVLRQAAAGIDADGVVPAKVREALAALDLTSAAPLARVVAIEELAVASASAAAVAGLDAGDAPGRLAGLRGVPVLPDAGPRQHFTMAAVCLGIGRSAIDAGLAAAKARGDRPGGDPAAPPHWALADAATEVDAARLLVRASAAGEGLPAAAALVFASGAAIRAVDAALRIVGPEGYATGGVLERCARDARAAVLLLGPEDSARMTAADGLLS